MYVAALAADLLVPGAGSRKEKRSVVRSLVAELGHLGVAAAETGHLDLRQRAEISAATVAGSAGHVQRVLDSLERVVRSRPDVEVVSVERRLWKGSDESDAPPGWPDGQPGSWLGEEPGDGGTSGVAGGGATTVRTEDGHG